MSVELVTQPAPSAARATLRGPVALRALAGAFAHLGDFDRFVGGLQAALDQADWFGRVRLQLGGPAAGSDLESGELVLPLPENGAAQDWIRATGRGESRMFGAEDLHLLAALADFLAAVLGRAREWRETERQRRLFELLLNQAPVGIVLFNADRSLAAANDLARRWLGDGSDLWAAVKAASATPGAGEPAPQACFHVRSEGRLVFGELRPAPAQLGGSGECVAVMSDLSADQARLLDALRRETYRCQWQHARLALVILEAPVAAGGLLQRLPELRTALPEVVAGPYDASRIGLLFPNRGRAAAAAQLRRLPLLQSAPPARAGIAELGREAGDPEGLLHAALAGLRPYAEAFRPSVLLHDDNPAVNDALSYVLGADFRIVKSTDLGATRQLLQSQVFDGLITEIELRGGSGLELARQAREWQPEMSIFYTTISELPSGALNEPGMGDAIVFQKPFDIRSLVKTVRDRIGA